MSGDLLADDTDADGTLTVVADTITTNDGGSVDIQADGDFVYTPVAGTSCTDASDFFDYEVTDGTDSDVGRVTIAIAGCVWYVSNNADGNSRDLHGAIRHPGPSGCREQRRAEHLRFRGDGTTTGNAAGIDLDAGQQLIGSAARPRRRRRRAAHRRRIQASDHRRFRSRRRRSPPAKPSAGLGSR